MKSPTEILNSKLSKAQREARAAFREVTAEVAISDAQREKIALLANRDRLRAERMAREASNVGGG